MATAMATIPAVTTTIATAVALIEQQRGAAAALLAFAIAADTEFGQEDRQSR